MKDMFKEFYKRYKGEAESNKGLNTFVKDFFKEFNKRYNGEDHFKKDDWDSY